MIIDPGYIKIMPECVEMPEETIRRKLAAIEDMIRGYTNNNFQNRAKRICAPSCGSKLVGLCEYFKYGDTVQITESPLNNGLYVIDGIDRENGVITLDKELCDADHNLVTKVEYPAAIVEGVVNLMLWEANMRDKVGVASETLSRHTVTYFSQDAVNQLMGYPATLLGFLKPFVKARF